MAVGKCFIQMVGVWREREKERELLAAGYIMYVLNFHFLILIIYILFFFFTRGWRDPLTHPRSAPATNVQHINNVTQTWAERKMLVNLFSSSIPSSKWRFWWITWSLQDFETKVNLYKFDQWNADKTQE